jgi:hypothetical protein
LLCCVAVAAGVARDAGDAEASLLDALSAALEANRQLPEAMAGLREENARLPERDAERKAEVEGLRADLAVLRQMLSGQSPEKSRPEPSGGDDTGGSGDPGRERGSGRNVKRSPGPGRRDYS